MTLSNLCVVQNVVLYILWRITLKKLVPGEFPENAVRVGFQDILGHL